MNRILYFLLVMLSATAAAGQGTELPSTFDLRDIDGHSYIGAVRDQGQCGSCYSFGALAAAEGTWNRAYNLHDSEAIDLSEAFIVWSLSPLYEGFHGCYGANYDYEELTALTEYGVPLEADFPYTVSDPGDNLHWDADRYRFQDWYRIPSNDIETTKRILSQIGAVDAAVYVDHDFSTYSEGIFDNTNTVINNVVPYYSSTNHAIALVDWNDEPGDGGMGYWILRNSWGDNWGNDGYMKIRYTSALVAMESTYLIATAWDGETTTLENSNAINAVPWIAGGTLNAHGVDLWGGAASRVTNRGWISAEASSTDELATARGVYLWGGPEGHVANAGDITGLASSQNNQAIAYAICLQGGRVDNSGLLQAEATSQADQALAFGVWAANGGNSVEIRNSGEMRAQAQGGNLNAAYGIWADSRELATVTNNGRIGVVADDRAVGVLLTGGPARLQNTGTIQASADLASGWGYGVYISKPSTILNSGTIGGTDYAIHTDDNTQLILETGSDLVGPVRLLGSADQLVLTGNGSEDESFIGVESLSMDGSDWSLSGDSAFDAIHVDQGRLGINGVISGETTIWTDGILGGNGTLTGDVANSGTVAPGHSIDHLSIDGDFTQDTDGTLEIEIGDGTADRLSVTGTAYLAGTLLVLPDGYTTGGSYTFLDANSIDGVFDTLQSAAVLDVDLSGNPSDSLSLDATRNSYSSLATQPNRSLAENLDNVRAGAEGDFADLLDGLDLAVTQSDLNVSLSELTPRIHGLATTAALDDSQNRFDSLRRRMERIDPAGMVEQEADDGTLFWVEMPAQYTDYASDGAYFGARKHLYGVMLGSERRADNGLRLGLATAVTESRYEADGSGDQGENQTLQSYLYGSWSDPEATEGWRLGAAIGVGMADFEADRAIAFSRRQSHSDHNGRILGTALQGGYDWTPGHWKFGVSFGVSWVQLREDGFRESGADSANLDVRDRQTDSFQGFWGARLARTREWAGFLVEPELRAQWLHEFSRDTADLKTHLAGDGNAFLTPGRDLAADSLAVGVGLKVQLSEMSFANLSYDCKLQGLDGTTDHALHVQMGMRF